MARSRRKWGSWTRTRSGRRRRQRDLWLNFAAQSFVAPEPEIHFFGSGLNDYCFDIFPSSSFSGKTEAARISIITVFCEEIKKWLSVRPSRWRRLFSQKEEEVHKAITFVQCKHLRRLSLNQWPTRLSWELALKLTKPEEPWSSG